MSIPVSVFLPEDSYIIKMPRSSMDNATSTKGPTSRTIDMTHPPESAEGVRGDYTAEGDEHTGGNYSIEYMIQVSNEGSGVNTSMIDGFESLIWSAMSDTSTDNVHLSSTVTQSSDLFVSTKSLSLNKTSGFISCGVERSANPSDFSWYQEGTSEEISLDVYLPSHLNVTSITMTLRTLTDQMTCRHNTSIVTGWQRVSFDLSSPYSVTGDFHLEDVTTLQIQIFFTSSSNTLSNILLDNLRGTKEVTGKIVTSDVEVDWYRNSAIQTKFEWYGSRWIPIHRSLGTISNNPRLMAPTFENDWTLRPIDFVLHAGATDFDVQAVDTDADFEDPPSESVQFSRDTGHFHFSEEDLVSLEGIEVEYTEILDGTSTVGSDGTCVIERDITISFQSADIPSQPDLTLYQSIEEYPLAEIGSAIQPIDLPATPVSLSLSYSSGETLVQGVDYIVDDHKVYFTSPCEEDLESDLDTFSVTNKGVVQESLSVFVGDTELIRDEDYVFDETSGLITRIQGPQEESLVGGLLTPTYDFQLTNMILTVDGSPTTAFKLNSTMGWVYLDEPLLSEVEVLATYRSGGVDYTEEFLTHKGEELPVSSGGERSLRLKHYPIDLLQWTAEAGIDNIIVSEDRTVAYVPNTLILMNGDPYCVASSGFDAELDTTVIYLTETLYSSYVNPDGYLSKFMSWSTVTETAGRSSVGSHTLTLTDAGYLVKDIGSYVTVDGGVYKVSSVSTDGNDLIITTSTALRVEVAESSEVTYSGNVYNTGDTKLLLKNIPLISVPERLDGDDVVPISERFPTIGSLYKLTRNEEVVSPSDYSIDTAGVVTLLNPITDSDTDISIQYMSTIRDSDTISVTYTYYSDSLEGVTLLCDYTYVYPDTFYVRVVDFKTQGQSLFDNIYDSPLSMGSAPTRIATPATYVSGTYSDLNRIAENYDNDTIVKAIYDFYDERISFLEAEKTELCGDVVGGYDGPIDPDTLSDIQSPTNRLFTNGEDTPDLKPCLFGLSLEDSGSTLISDVYYPSNTVTGFPPTVSTPRFYGSYGVPAKATFIEHWYPLFLDTFYCTFDDTPLDTSSLTVNQDNSTENERDICFPPETPDLDPDDFSGSFESTAPRTMIKGYEGAAIGALQSIDSAIESQNISGYRHRSISGDDDSYWDGLGWIYRDHNEFDLLVNGSSPELDQLQAQWSIAPGSRTTPPEYQETIEREILTLKVQKASLTRQKDALESLISQYEAESSPEIITVQEALQALANVDDYIDLTTSAITSTVNFYNTSILGNLWSNGVIKNRWTYLTGIDPTSTTWPSPLPESPLLNGRITAITVRHGQIVDRLTEINRTLGYDKTTDPEDLGDESENLYQTRYDWLNMRCNRTNGTLHQALVYHSSIARSVTRNNQTRNKLKSLGFR